MKSASRDYYIHRCKALEREAAELKAKNAELERRLEEALKKQDGSHP